MVRVYKNEEINELSKYLMQEYGVSYRHFKVAIKPLVVTGGLEYDNYQPASYC